MSSDPTRSDSDTTVTTTTLPDGTRRVVTTTVLPNGTRTTTQLLPSLPAVNTETIPHADGSGSTVKETTSVVHPGGRREVTIRELFVPASPSPSAITQEVVAEAVEPNSTSSAPCPCHEDTNTSSTSNHIIGENTKEESRDHDGTRAPAERLLHLAKSQSEEERVDPILQEATAGEQLERDVNPMPPIAKDSTIIDELSDSRSNTTSSKITATAPPPKNERDSISNTKFRSGWSSTPKVPKAQSFVPLAEPRETAVQRRRREEKERQEAVAQQENEEEERCRLAKEEEVGRLERERLAAVEEAIRLDQEKEAEATRLEQKKIADEEAAWKAEFERVAKQAELDSLEQERIKLERALVEQQQQILTSIQNAAPVPNETDDVARIEEGGTEFSQSPAPAGTVREEVVEDTGNWLQRNKYRCSSLLILLLALMVGWAVLTEDNTDDDTAAASSAAGSGGGTVDDVTPITLVVDRSCEYIKSDTVYVSVIDNGVNNGMYGGISDFDEDNAVVVSTAESSGIGAVWALSKSSGSWGQTAFQTDEDNRFGWDVAMGGDYIVVGVPDGGDKGFFQDSGRGTAVVLTKDSGGSWYKQATLSPKVADSGAEFGISVDISDCGCFIAVSAWKDRDGRGSVYVYSRTSSGWTETQKLSPYTASQTQSDFYHGNYGHTVAISDSMLAVKAPFDYINGRRGAVYVYTTSSKGRYAYTDRFSTPEGPQTETYHSPQVVLLDDFVLVGAPEYDKVYVFKQNSSQEFQKTTELTASDATSRSNFGVKIGGRGTDILVSDRGDDSTYLFSYEGGVWKEKAKFDGYHAALSGNSIVVHSPFEFELNGRRYGGQVSFYDLVCDGV